MREITFPFLIAGFGMVTAGCLLDKVKHEIVFKQIPEIFILVPALLGLKGEYKIFKISISDEKKTGLSKSLEIHSHCSFETVFTVH